MNIGLKQRLIAQAKAEGFDACRLCRPWDVGHVPERLAAFLAQGYHGQMGWLAERSEWRGAPQVLWPDARTVIMLGESYTPEGDPLAGLSQRDCGNISVYARNRDYHDTVKKRLKRLARWLIDAGGGEVKVFVDTAPVPEKPLGQAAGLGWQGKHTNLVSRELGSWFFIGSIFTILEIDTDPAEIDHCGSCRACLDVCPTKAFPAPYQLDARRCISYLTIEHKGPVDAELRPGLGNRISGSPIKRIGRDRFLRNVLYAIGNSADTSLRAVAQAHCEDPDAAVADAARWAVLRLDRDANGLA